MPHPANPLLHHSITPPLRHSISALSLWLLHPRAFCRKYLLMHISKSFLATCLSVLAAAPFWVRADDTEAQIKAREALIIKMQEVQAQQPATNLQPSAAEPRTAKPMSKTPAPARPLPPVEQFAPAPRLVPPAASTASAPRPVPPADQKPAMMLPKPAPAPLANQAPAPSPVAQPEPAPKLAAPPPADSEAIRKAREALREKMKELEGQPPAGEVAPAAVPAPTPAPPVAKPAPAPATIAQPAPAPVAPRRSPGIGSGRCAVRAPRKRSAAICISRQAAGPSGRTTTAMASIKPS